MITQETFTMRCLDGVVRRYDQGGKRVFGPIEGEPDIDLKPEIPQVEHVRKANEDDKKRQHERVR